jgi:hypothetical protein
MELSRSCSLLPKWFSCGLFNSVSFLSSYKAQWTVFLGVPDLTWAKWPLCKSTWLFCKSMKTIMQWSVCARYSNCACLEIWDSLAIGSYTTEMIPLILGNLATHPNSLQLGPIVQRWSPIQWPWITAELNATTQSFRESCRTKPPSICFVSMTYRCLGCLVLGLIVFGSKLEQAVHTGPYERKHSKAIGLISSVIWVVHFILFCPSTKQWPTLYRADLTCVHFKVILGNGKTNIFGTLQSTFLLETFI